MKDRHVHGQRFDLLSYCIWSSGTKRTWKYNSTYNLAIGPGIPVNVAFEQFIYSGPMYAEITPRISINISLRIVISLASTSMTSRKGPNPLPVHAALNIARRDS